MSLTYPNSSNVSAGGTVLAADWNNIRKDALIIEAQIPVVGVDVSLATGDGKARLDIGDKLADMYIVSCKASCKTAGATGDNEFQIRNATQAYDVLTGKLTLSAGSVFSGSTQYTINPSNNQVSLNDQIYFDVDTVSTGTPPIGEVLITVGFSPTQDVS